MSRLFRLLALLLLIASVQAGVAHANFYPLVNWRTPSSGASAEPGTPVLLAGHAVNGEAGGVISVELSFDAGATWEQAELENETWSYHLTPAGPGTVNVIARASTNQVVGNPSQAITLHVGSPGVVTPVTGETILHWPSQPGKPRINENDDQPVELGVRTRFDQSGHITGAIIGRGTYTGPLVLRVWSQEGTLLGEHTSQPGTYVERVMLPAPIPVGPGADYVVSYYTPVGGYAQTENYFTGTVIYGPFSAPVGAGVYRYGGGFPTDSWHNANYWISPIFAP